MIDVALQLRVGDAKRHFDLDIAFASDAPVVALYGPSGAGKSLTLQAMAGLLGAQRGHVRIGGRSLFDSAAGIDVPARARRLGFLFQHYALFPHLSVRENVAFGLTSWRTRLSHGEAERVDTLIQTFELSAMAAARPATLSGGQQQRVALARALACAPDALLLDEPFAALSPLLRRSLRAELAQVRERWRIPMVMITHDVEDVLALANVAFLVEEGRVVREVDLDRAESREAQRDMLTPAAARRPRRPHEEALRVMLGAGGSDSDA